MTSKEDDNLDVEKYFLPNEWSKMSDYEKTRLTNILENYQKLKSFDFRPQEPAFVKEYKIRQEENEKRATTTASITTTTTTTASTTTASTTTTASKSAPNLKITKVGEKDSLNYYMKRMKFNHNSIYKWWNTGRTSSAGTGSKSSPNLKDGAKAPTSTKVVHKVNEGATTSSGAASISAQLLKKGSRKSSSAVEVPSSLSVRLDVEKYFSFVEWRQKTKVERKRLRAELETYSLNRTFGKNPEAPVFVVAYKERKIRDWERDREKISDGSSKNTKTKKSWKPSIDDANQVNDVSCYCAECNSVFTSPLFLEQHEIGCFIGIGARRKENVAASENVAEETCNKQIGTAAISVQKPKTTPAAGKGFKCDICNVKFARKDNLTRHIKGIHDKVRPFKCEDCDADFVHKSDLTKHINGVHLKVCLYKCNMCKYKCLQNGNLQTHINSVHMKLLSFECTMCNYKSSENGNLQKHIKSVHMNLRPFECTRCNYKFQRNADLQRHMVVHSGVKAYQCTLCNNKFTRSDYLTKHIKTVHK